MAGDGSSSRDAGDDGGVKAEEVLWSAIWGFISATSLIIGAIWGVFRLPKQSIRAAMMAFGGGALLFALSIELFGHVLHMAEELDNNGLIFTMIGASLFGGAFFAWLNRVLNSFGADIRHESTHKPKINQLRKLLSRKLLAALRKAAMFNALSPGELNHYVCRRLQRRQLHKGSKLFDRDVTHYHRGSLYVVLKGKITLERGPLRHKEVQEAVVKTASTGSTGKAWQSHVGKYGIFGEGALHMAKTEVEDPSKRGAILSATAAKDTLLLVFQGEDLIELMQEGGDLEDVLTPLWKAWAIETLFEVPSLFQDVPPQLWEESFFPFMTLRHFEEGNSALLYSNSHSNVFFVLFGCIEINVAGIGQSRIHASGLLGLEHMQTKKEVQLNAVAVEETWVLEIDRVACLENFLLAAGGHTATSNGAAAGKQPEAPLPGAMGSGAIVPAGEPAIMPGTPGSGNKVFPETSPRSGDQEPKRQSLAARLSVSLLGGAGMNKRASLGKCFEHLEAPHSDLDVIAKGAALHHMERIEAEDDKKGMHAKLLHEEDEAEVAIMPYLVSEDDLEKMAGSKRGNQSGLRDSGDEGGAGSRPTTVENEGGGHGHGGHGGSASAAVMVWVGILLDAVPESLVIGILVVATGGPPLPFIIGVFLSNLPESMSSSGTMRCHGIRKRVILAMWFGIVVVTTVGAALGAILFPANSTDDPNTVYIVVGVEGVAAGAMLTMIAQTMLPEAFEQGGDVVGLSCLLGFLAALCVRLLPVGNDDGHRLLLDLVGY